MSLYRSLLLEFCLLVLCSSCLASLQVPPHRPRIFATRSPNPWSRPPSKFALFTPLSSSPSTFCNSSSVSPLHHDDSSAPLPDSPDCPPSKPWAFQPARTVLLMLWVLVLFYLLGTTASDYFSCTLEKLSEVWGLSPAVAGVTLLAVGNGAPDVFSSVAAFLSSDQAGSIGFSCVLGGALFITTVVSGTVALVTAARTGNAGFVRIDPVSFGRDVVFLLISAGVLAIVLRDGKVDLGEAIGFFSVYVVYAMAVWLQEILQKRLRSHFSWDSPLLDSLLPKAEVTTTLPQWSSHCQQSPPHLQRLLCKEMDALEIEEQPVATKSKHLVLLFYKYAVEWPFALPRRITIPIIDKERWSRPLTVVSCVMAPGFVAGVWVFQSHESSDVIAAGISLGLGIIFGLLAFFTTEDSRPPQRFIGVWLSAGFVMSIVWFYLIADRLVDALQSLGEIFQVSPAILGLTVLAWGNCIGDLVADLALACSGNEGVQIAVSGCYSGPLFNVVVGLGLSLVIACWRSSPEPFIIIDDGSLFYIIGFLVAGLAWALVVLPLGGMRLSRSLGFGLVLVYVSFLVAGMVYEMGWISTT